MKKTLACIALLGLLVFTTFAVLYPNPYGNNPDVIADESYFLTSSLNAMQKMTLPGWEFSVSGNYYGGPQTYLDTVVLVPVVAAVLASSHFSLLKTQAWVALNTGVLLHILRLVNGILALATLVFLFFFFKKRKIPRKLALMLTLFAFFLFSNVVFIEFLHTAKVWTVYVLIVAIMSALFIANEYYLSYLQKPFIRKETYVALMIWAAVLAFFQNYVGVLSIFLLMFYAILLGHMTVKDIWAYVKKWWYLIIAVGLTQISFIYRAIFMNGADGSFSNISIKTANNTIDWLPRLYDPLVSSVMSQPLIWLYVLCVLIVIFFAFYKKSFFSNSRKRMYMVIACVHPIIVYILFHVIVGFSSAPRYAIIMTFATSFSTVILLSEMGTILPAIALTASVVLFFIVNIHAIVLYWHPSSEVQFLQIMSTNYDSANTVFIEEPSALRLTLPTNATSLALLDQKRQAMGRFSFLLQHPELVQEDVSFKPLTMLVYSPEEEQAALTKFDTGTTSVWTISSDDPAELCSAGETAAGTCFEVHPDACYTNSSQEVNTLPVFLAADQLGDCYIAHKVH